MLLLVLSLALPVLAQDDDDDLDFLEEGERNAAALAGQQAPKADDFSAFDAEDEDFGDFQLKVEQKPAPPPKPPEAAPPPVAAKPGQAPLADNFAPTVRKAASGAMVVELPVLLAAEGAPPPQRGWLVVEVIADGRKVAEQRQPLPTTAGPHFAYVKVQVPVTAASGAMELKVGVAGDATGAPKALFSRAATYGS